WAAGRRPLVRLSCAMTSKREGATSSVAGPADSLPTCAADAAIAERRGHIEETLENRIANDTARRKRAALHQRARTRGGGGRSRAEKRDGRRPPRLIRLQSTVPHRYAHLQTSP